MADMTHFLGVMSSAVVDLIETAVIGISIFLVIYLLFMQPHQVSGRSMFPFLKDKDYVLTDKVSYRLHPPRRGDIVVFHAPLAANCPTGAGCDYIKRVVGLPGEQVEVRDNGIFINGSQLPEPYIASDVLTEPGFFSRDRIVTLGEQEFFLVGDNREHSADSRAWGPVEPSNIVGRAFFRYWPLNTMLLLPHTTYPKNTTGMAAPAL